MSNTPNTTNTLNFMVSRYNQDIGWVSEYAPSMILYDRSDQPFPGSNIVANIGTDIMDKLNFIIWNYNNLPDVCIYTKANLFKYITKEEFDKVKDNKVFTPLLTNNHRTYKGDDGKDVCFYKDGIYYEINNGWYLAQHPCKYNPIEVMEYLGIDKLQYIPFAPGSNYILTKENIHKHPVDFYMKLLSYINWAVYPGEAQIIERGLYTIWNDKDTNFKKA